MSLAQLIVNLSRQFLINCRFSRSTQRLHLAFVCHFLLFQMKVKNKSGTVLRGRGKYDLIIEV